MDSQGAAGNPAAYHPGKACTEHTSGLRSCQSDWAAAPGLAWAGAVLEVFGPDL